MSWFSCCFKGWVERGWGGLSQRSSIALAGNRFHSSFLFLNVPPSAFQVHHGHNSFQIQLHGLIFHRFWRMGLREIGGGRLESFLGASLTMLTFLLGLQSPGEAPWDPGQLRERGSLHPLRIRLGLQLFRFGAFQLSTWGGQAPP